MLAWKMSPARMYSTVRAMAFSYSACVKFDCQPSMTWLPSGLRLGGAAPPVHRPCWLRRDDPGALLHVVEGGDAIDSDAARDRGRGARNPGSSRWVPAGGRSRRRCNPPARPERAEGPEHGAGGFRTSRLMIASGDWSCRRAVEEGSLRRHLQRRHRIAGEEGVAAEVFRAHDAFEKRQVALALEAERQGGGLEADDLAGVGFPHGPPI